MAISSDFLTGMFLWFVRAFISSAICIVIGMIAIKAQTYWTRGISEFKDIKGDPMATGLFVSGFLIFAGLVVYGSMVSPFFLGQNLNVGSYFNVQRLLVVVLSFFVSLLFGWIFYYAFSKVKLFGVEIDDVNKSPVAVGVYLFGYEVFLGLIIFGALMIPLG